MNRLFTYVSSLLLLILFGLSTFFVYLYMDVSVFMVKRDAVNNIHGNRGMETLRIACKDFKKVDEHEIMLKGKLYDISNYKIAGDTVIVTAMHDEKEEGLLNSIHQFFSSDTQRYYYASGNHIYHGQVKTRDEPKILPTRYHIAICAATFHSYTIAGKFSLPAGHIKIAVPPPRNAFPA